MVFLATLDSPVNPSGMYIFDSQGVREIGRVHGAVNAVSGPGGSTPAGATFGFFDPPVICDNGDVYFMANLNSGVLGITSDNDTVIFRYRNHALSVVAREGSQIPGQPAGRIFGFAASPLGANAFGQLVFIGQVLNPGGTPGTLDAVFSTDRLGTPQVIYKSGDVLNVRGGLMRTFSNFAPVLRSGGNDGRPQSINTRGEIALAASCNVAPGTPHGQNGRSIVVFDGLVGPCGVADTGSQGGLFGADGILDNNDFIAFINLFFAGHSAADVGVQGGGAGSDGQLDNNDFIAFITAFFAGCA